MDTNIGFVLLLKSNISGTYERLAIKKKLLEIIIIIITITYFEWYTRQSCSTLTYLS